MNSINSIPAQYDIHQTKNANKADGIKNSQENIEQNNAAIGTEEYKSGDAKSNPMDLNIPAPKTSAITGNSAEVKAEEKAEATKSEESKTFLQKAGNIAKKVGNVLYAIATPPIVLGLAGLVLAPTIAGAVGGAMLGSAAMSAIGGGTALSVAGGIAGGGALGAAGFMLTQKIAEKLIDGKTLLLGLGLAMLGV